MEAGGNVQPMHMSYTKQSGVLETLGRESDKEPNRCPYTDDLSVSWLGWIQTPQYFEHCYELRVLGDPCGHRNAVFFDAVQCGLDGYGSAFFAGTNAVFRRAALDSIGGIKYGTLTEDAFTGRCLNKQGWDSGYFRKDWEGDPTERFYLCTGDVPESVSATFKQRKRWSQGSCEIQMMEKERPDELMDQVWWKKFQAENYVDCPPSGKDRPLVQRFMRFCFFFNAMYYPWHAFAAIIYYAVNCYMMVMGTLPFYLNSEVVFFAMVPWIVLRGYMNRLASVSVANSDSQRGQETWFSFAPIFILALWDAAYNKMTGLDAKWANTGGLKGRGSILELPNVLIMFTIFSCFIYSLIRFYEFDGFETPWQWFPGIFFGGYLMAQLWPMTKMSIQEYMGWSYDSLTDFSGYLTTLFFFAFLIFFCATWKTTYTTSFSCSPFWADFCFNTTTYNRFRIEASVGVTGDYMDEIPWYSSSYETVQLAVVDSTTGSVDQMDVTYDDCWANKLWALTADQACSSGTNYTQAQYWATDD